MCELSWQNGVQNTGTTPFLAVRWLGGQPTGGSNGRSIGRRRSVSAAAGGPQVVPAREVSGLTSVAAGWSSPPSVCIWRFVGSRKIDGCWLVYIYSQGPGGGGLIVFAKHEKFLQIRRETTGKISTEIDTVFIYSIWERQFLLDSLKVKIKVDSVHLQNVERTVSTHNIGSYLQSSLTKSRKLQSSLTKSWKRQSSLARYWETNHRQSLKFQKGRLHSEGTRYEHLPQCCERKFSLTKYRERQSSFTKLE
jgi:hypothetical protein